MYSLPSTSRRWDPWPLAMKGGVPPILRNALTGELTPPGISCCARANSASERERLYSTRIFTGDQFVQKEVHYHLVESAVQVLEQPAFQPEVWLRSGEQVLHEIAEARTAPDELDH